MWRSLLVGRGREGGREGDRLEEHVQTYSAIHGYTCTCTCTVHVHCPMSTFTHVSETGEAEGQGDKGEGKRIETYSVEGRRGG